MYPHRLSETNFVLMAILCTGGCSSPPMQTGVRIGDVTLEQFEAGITTASWLLAVLGPPTSESHVEGVEDTTVLRYALGESASGLGAIFSGKANKNTAVVYFVVTNGIVTRFWADREVERTITGRAVQELGGEKVAE
jgi:hypothetical protein